MRSLLYGWTQESYRWNSPRNPLDTRLQSVHFRKMKRIEPIAELNRVLRRIPNVAEWAREKGVSPSYVANAAAGRCCIGPAILAAIGLEEVRVFRRVRKDS